MEEKEDPDRVLARYFAAKYVEHNTPISTSPDPSNSGDAPEVASSSGKTAKKNRKEKERRARRRMEMKSQENPKSSEPKEEVAEPHQAKTPPSPDRHVTISSSSPPTAHQPSTVRPSTSRASRPLIQPAIPYNLHLPNKSLASMQRDNSDKQHPPAGRESEVPGSPTSAVNIMTPETQLKANAALRSAEDYEQATTPLPIAESSTASASETSYQEGGETGTSHARTETAGKAALVSVEDQTQTITPLPIAESSESTEAITALDSLSIQPTQLNTPASGPSDDTRVTPTHPITTSPPENLAQPPTQPRLIKFDTYEWPCRNHECRKVTSPWDGSTVICPRCGPYSQIRYCSQKCLFHDVLLHWGVDCGDFTLAARADPLTIHPRQVKIQPFIPSLTHHDRPERHRQLVRHSLDEAADYFIFSDWTDWRADGFPADWPARKHASGRILVALNFTPNGSSVPAKLFFRRLIRICFLAGGIHTDMAYFLFKMMRGRLHELGLASEDVKNCLVWQFKHEFAYPGGFADLLEDEQPVNWPIVAGQIVQLEARYRSFLFGGAGLGSEWSNAV